MKLLRPTRREILKLAAIAPAFALPALPARALIGAPSLANPTHFRFTIGEARLTVLSDGHFTVPTSTIGINAAESEMQAFLTQYHLAQDVHYNHTNHLFIELGDAKVLVDVGSGTRVFNSTGRLIENLDAAGIDSSEITHVVITHAHPDHIWGIRDDFDEAIFPDAEYVMGEAEHDYWTQDGLVNKVEEASQQMVVGAVNSINADGVEWTLGGDGHEVAPGVRLVATHGHTKGHMSIAVESGGKQLLALGDSMTHAYMNFLHPDWLIENDEFPEETVVTRNRILDMASADDMAVIGYHFPFPGVGHVSRDKDGYMFVPALWQWGDQ